MLGHLHKPLAVLARAGQELEPARVFSDVGAMLQHFDGFTPFTRRNYMRLMLKMLHSDSVRDVMEAEVHARADADLRAAIQESDRECNVKRKSQSQSQLRRGASTPAADASPRLASAADDGQQVVQALRARIAIAEASNAKLIDIISAMASALAKG